MGDRCTSENAGLARVAGARARSPSIHVALVVELKKGRQNLTQKGLVQSNVHVPLRVYFIKYKTNLQGPYVQSGGWRPPRALAVRTNRAKGFVRTLPTSRKRRF